MNNILDNNTESQVTQTQEIKSEQIIEAQKTLEEKIEQTEIPVAKSLDEVVKEDIQVIDKNTGRKRRIRRFHLGSEFELRIKHHKYLYWASAAIFAISLGSLIFETIKFNKDMKIWPEAFLLTIALASVILSFLTVFVWRIVLRIKHKEMFQGLILIGDRVTVWDEETPITQGYLLKARLTWYFGIKVSIQAFGYKEIDIIVKYLEIDIPHSKLNIWYRYFETPESPAQKQFLTIDIDERKVEFYKKIYNNITKE